MTNPFLFNSASVTVGYGNFISNELLDRWDKEDRIMKSPGFPVWIQNLVLSSREAKINSI